MPLPLAHILSNPLVSYIHCCKHHSFLSMSPNFYPATRHGKNRLMELPNPPGPEPTLTLMMTPKAVLGNGPSIWLPSVSNDPQMALFKWLVLLIEKSNTMKDQPQWDRSSVWWWTGRWHARHHRFPELSTCFWNWDRPQSLCWPSPFMSSHWVRYSSPWAIQAFHYACSPESWHCNLTCASPESWHYGPTHPTCLAFSPHRWLELGQYISQCTVSAGP